MSYNALPEVDCIKTIAVTDPANYDLFFSVDIPVRSIEHSNSLRAAQPDLAIAPHGNDQPFWEAISNQGLRSPSVRPVPVHSDPVAMRPTTDAHDAVESVWIHDVSN